MRELLTASQAGPDLDCFWRLCIVFFTNISKTLVAFESSSWMDAVNPVQSFVIDVARAE